MANGITAGKTVRFPWDLCSFEMARASRHLIDLRSRIESSMNGRKGRDSCTHRQLPQCADELIEHSYRFVLSLVHITWDPYPDVLLELLRRARVYYAPTSSPHHELIGEAAWQWDAVFEAASHFRRIPVDNVRELASHETKRLRQLTPLVLRALREFDLASAHDGTRCYDETTLNALRQSFSLSRDLDVLFKLLSKLEPWARCVRKERWSGCAALLECYFAHTHGKDLAGLGVDADCIETLTDEIVGAVEELQTFAANRYRESMVESEGKPSKEKKTAGRNPDPEIARLKKRVVEAWESKRFKTMADLAREMGLKYDFVRKAISAHRERQRQRQPPC